MKTHSLWSVTQLIYALKCGLSALSRAYPSRFAFVLLFMFKYLGAGTKAEIFALRMFHTYLAAD